MCRLQDGILTCSIREENDMDVVIREAEEEWERIGAVIFCFEDGRVETLTEKQKEWVRELMAITIFVLPSGVEMESIQNLADMYLATDISEAYEQAKSMLYGKELGHVRLLKQYFNLFKQKETVNRGRILQEESICFCKLVHGKFGEGHGV